MIQLSLFPDMEKEQELRKAEGGLHKVVGCLGASCFSEEDREANDFYATDPVAAEWLIRLENLSHNIYEPACGKGHLARVLEAHGYNVLATDLIDRGYGQGGVDFFLQNKIFHGDIVTNPPYKYSQEFVEHALSIIPDGNKVCMFLKLQFLEGKARKELFKKYPPCRVWVSSSRIDCGKNGVFVEGGSMLAQAWYIWQKGYCGETILKWFN